MEENVYRDALLELLEALRGAEREGLDLERYHLAHAEQKAEALVGHLTWDRVEERKKAVAEMFAKRKMDGIKLRRLVYYLKNRLPEGGKAIPEGSLEEQINYLIENVDPDELKEVATRTLGWTAQS